MNRKKKNLYAGRSAKGGKRDNFGNCLVSRWNYKIRAQLCRNCFNNFFCSNEWRFCNKIKPVAIKT